MAPAVNLLREGVTVEGGHPAIDADAGDETGEWQQHIALLAACCIYLR